MFVIKSSGEKQRYKRKKLIKSLQASGIPRKIAEKIVLKAEKSFYNNIPTSEIHKIIVKLLDQHRFGFSISYSLKKALFDLGPTGYPFEKYIARILQEYNFKTQVDQIIQGKCVSHEVDIVAQREDKTFLIECKFHNQPGTKSDVKTTLYVNSRFIDIIENRKNKYRSQPYPWIITNTKFTLDAISYAECRGIKITAWNYPRGKNLQSLIEKKLLYPLTVFKEISSQKLSLALEKEIIVLKDILDKEEFAKEIFGSDYLRLILKIKAFLHQGFAEQSLKSFQKNSQMKSAQLSSYSA